MKTLKIIKKFSLAALVLTTSARLWAQEPYHPKSGDVVFQSMEHSQLIDMIEGVTSSPFSHCGIVTKQGKDWCVIEAIGPVTVTPLKEWIERGRDGGFAAYRLNDKYTNNVEAFVKAAFDYLGKPYDIHYDMDDEKIYCSELVFKAFRKAVHEDLGKLVKLQDLNWKPYAGIIRQIENGPVPLQRKIISPANVTRAPQLHLIYSRNISADAPGA